MIHYKFQHSNVWFDAPFKHAVDQTVFIRFIESRHHVNRVTIRDAMNTGGIIRPDTWVEVANIGSRHGAWTPRKTQVSEPPLVLETFDLDAEFGLDVYAIPSLKALSSVPPPTYADDFAMDNTDMMILTAFQK
jgi:hypothetical protein